MNIDSEAFRYIKNALFSAGVVLVSILSGIGAGLAVSMSVLNLSSSEVIGTEAFDLSLNIIRLVVGVSAAAFISSFLVSTYDRQGLRFYPLFGLMVAIVASVAALFF